MPSLRRPSAAPPVLVGFLDLGKRQVAVIDLALVIGNAVPRASPEERLYRAIILLASPFRDIGLLVSSVVDVRRVPASCVTPPDAMSPPFVCGLVAVDGHTVELLDAAAIIDRQARLRLDALTAGETARTAQWDATWESVSEASSPGGSTAGSPHV